MKTLLVLAVSLLAPLSSAADPWIERVAEAVHGARADAEAPALERRAVLDEVARVYAEKVAAMPHQERLVQKNSIEAELRAAGVKRFRRASLHLDMGRGYRDPGKAFARNWEKHEVAWETVRNPEFDSMGIGTATGDDHWVVLTVVFVDEIKIPTDIAAIERATVAAINNVRADHDLKPLEIDVKLTVTARLHSRSMADHDYFSHTGDDGSTPAQRAQRQGIDFEVLSENIHSSIGYEDPVLRAVAAWMDSPGHRTNLLDKRVTHTGVGVAIDEDGNTVFTQLFLLPASRR